MRLLYSSFLLMMALVMAIPSLAHPLLLGAKRNGERESGTGPESGGKEENDIAPPMPVLTPLHRTFKDAVYETAYMDTFNILSEENTCSRFYGGPEAAVYVFNKLIQKLHKAPLEYPSIAIKMSGETISVENYRTGLSYRLFETATVNSNGPFYRKKSLPTDLFVPNIGSFPPNTREARVLILLHELAHLMKGPDGQWLIPDDGNNREQSYQNTATVESRCGPQIGSLKNRKPGSTPPPPGLLATSAELISNEARLKE